MHDISFGKAELSEALRLSVLLKTVYIQTYDIEGITIESANFITKAFAKERIEGIIKDHRSQFMVARHRGNLVGAAEILFDSMCPIRKIALPELGKLYVLECFYGKGVGYGLLNAVENEVKKQGFKELHLMVYIKNTRAIAFYERQGYVTLGMTDFKMEHNTYKNLVMNKVLN